MDDQDAKVILDCISKNSVVKPNTVYINITHATICRHKARLFKKQHGHCFYCNKLIEQANWSIDHKVPKARGGSIAASSNLIGCCVACNHLKDILTFDEFWLIRHDKPAVMAMRRKIRVQL